MANLYLVTGPAGVGKSTISFKIAEKCEKSAVIEGDTIYNQVVGSYQSAWKEGNHLDLFWELSVKNIQTYLDHGYDVVFNYIIKPETLDFIKQNVNADLIKLVVLLVDDEVLLQRDAERPEDCQMKERCITLLNNFRKRNYNKNNILDTTNLSVSETVDAVVNEDRFILNWCLMCIDIL